MLSFRSRVYSQIRLGEEKKEKRKREMITRLRTSITVLSLLMAGVLLFGLPGGAAAADLEAPEVEVSTPVYFPSDQYSFREGTYKYEISWQGIPAADAELSITREGDLYRVMASARTNSVVDVFYKLRYQAAGSISAEDFSPGILEIDQRENSKVTKASIHFTDEGKISSQLTKTGREPRIYNFDLNNYTLEPLSASLLARSLDWEPGITRSFDTFDGKSRYLITLKCVDELEVTINGKKRKVWEVEPSVTNLNKNEKHDKLRRATMYVTADKYREVLQLVSEVYVGSVVTKLIAFEPREKKAIQLAQNLSSPE